MSRKQFFWILFLTFISVTVCLAVGIPTALLVKNPLLTTIIMLLVFFVLRFTLIDRLARKHIMPKRQS